jgi:nitrite reductase/ring-hydroxylating ferredoxin subunit
MERPGKPRSLGPIKLRKRSREAADSSERMPVFVRVAKAAEVPPGNGRVVVVQGHPVALFNVQGRFYAISNVCLHRGGPVGEGQLDGEIVTCPMHGWEYDVRTGANTINPAARLKTYEVRLEGDDVLVGA